MQGQKENGSNLEEALNNKDQKSDEEDSSQNNKSVFSIEKYFSNGDVERQNQTLVGGQKYFGRRRNKVARYDEETTSFNELAPNKEDEDIIVVDNSTEGDKQISLED